MNRVPTQAKQNKPAWALTSTGRIFCVLSVVFYAASMTSQSGLLLLLIGLFGAVLLINLWEGRRIVARLKLQAPEEVLVEQGSRGGDPWRLTNDGPQVAQFLEVIARGVTLLRVARIEANSTHAAIPDIQYTARGIFSLGEVEVAAKGSFGLVRVSKSAGVTGRIIVYPQLTEMASPATAGFEQVSGGKLSGKGRTSTGASFAGARPWVAGDSFRSIHWKSSATQGRLMVKIFDEELSGKVAIILALSGGDRDECIRAAGSLAVAAMQDGHQVEFLVLGESAPLFLQPFGELRDLLVKLAEIPAADNLLTHGLNYPRQISEMPISRKAAVCFCANGVDDFWLQLAEQGMASGRKVACLLPAGAQHPRLQHLLVNYFGDVNSTTVPAEVGA